jgi:hypothetical protein
MGASPEHVAGGSDEVALLGESSWARLHPADETLLGESTQMVVGPVGRGPDLHKSRHDLTAVQRRRVALEGGVTIGAADPRGEPRRRFGFPGSAP